MKRLATLALCLTCFGCGSDASDDGQGGAGGGSAECNGPGARFATGVAAFEVGTGQDHGQDTFVIDDGVQWRWTDPEAERNDAELRARLAP